MKIQDPEPNQNEKKDPDPWQNITDALCLYLLHPLTGIVQAYIFLLFPESIHCDHTDLAPGI